MDYYAGIDVSLEQSSVCVVDAGGKIIHEAKVASEPDALIAWLPDWDFQWFGLGSRLARCRNGFLQPCGKGGFWSNCWRHGTCVLRSRRCR